MAEEYDEQAPVRIQLALDTTPRNADLSKDALLQNCFIDGSQMGTAYAVKRPGFYVGSEAITTGLNRGIFVNPNNVTGGTPGQVQVWYVGATNGSSSSTGGGNLDSFSISDDPSSEVLVMSGDWTGGSGVMTYLSDGDDTLGLVIANIDPNVIFFGGVYPSDVTFYSTEFVIANYKLTKDASNFYCYIDDVLVATSPYVFTGYVTENTAANVSNAQYGPPEG